jgi:hypothetical protein
VKNKIVVKPPRNSAGFCGGGHGLSWAVEPRKEEKSMYVCMYVCMYGRICVMYVCMDGYV